MPVTYVIDWCIRTIGLVDVSRAAARFVGVVSLSFVGTNKGVFLPGLVEG
jgi:hypothetical protein